MGRWQKLSKPEIKRRVFEALDQNIDFVKTQPLGIPGSHLDKEVFYQDAPFLKDAPFLSTLIHNPNHIGCHTLGKSEPFFAGTQSIERDLIAICAEDILGAQPNTCDGYVASGGSEANMQAIWIYRNYFLREHGAALDQISILCSSDAHYSMDKAADVMGVAMLKVDVDDATRVADPEDLRAKVRMQTDSGCRYFIVVANMMTTMFGSVDDIDILTAPLDESGVLYKVHVDGAYGGFIYPFTNPANPLNFANPKVNSVTLDAHKMVQAPYGTGVFLVRKGWMRFANTQSASYVAGEDFTLIGSRSGANAVAVWMILMTYGRFGWEEKMTILLKRTDWLVGELKAMGADYYRGDQSNIVTIRANHLSPEIARRFGLVPDNHNNPSWYKVVVMEHVTIEALQPLVGAMRETEHR